MQKLRLAVKAGTDLLIRHCSLSIIVVNAIIIFVNTAIFYQLIPILLNYPPDVDEFSKSFSIENPVQYSILSLICVVLISIITYVYVHDIDTWHAVQNSDAADREERLASIRNRCRTLPNRLYAIHIIIPAILLFVYSLFYSAFFGYTVYSFLPIILIVIIFFSLTALVNFIFSKKLFTGVLQRIGIYDRLEGKRTSLKRKVLFQILPICAVSIIFTSMLGYARLIEDRSAFLFTLYKSQLESRFSDMPVKGIQDIQARLSSIDIESTKTQDFIIKADGKLITSDGKPINRFFTYYAQTYSDRHSGRVYDEVGSHNGAVIRLQIEEGTLVAGVRYKLSSASTMFYLEGNFIILILITIFIIYLSSGTIANGISEVASSLQEIAAGWNIKSSGRIPLTSNDEIGELVLAINRIRDLELEYDTMKNEFIANISHEFRTPLNIILNAIQLSSRYISRSPETEEYQRLFAHLGTMRQNCYRLLKLINNMIDSSKLEASFFKLYRQNCNIVSDIRHITMSVSDYIKDKEITLNFTSNTEKKIIAVDPEALERIMLNLLSNAVKFSGKGSSVTVGVTDRGESVEISVKDTGIGIPEEKLEAIFTRFNQVGGMLTKSHEGSGIGLSIVKSLVEMHSGKITVSSKHGEGAEFIVALPSGVLPVQFEGEDDREQYENKFQSGIEKIDIEFSDV